MFQKSTQSTGTLISKDTRDAAGDQKGSRAVGLLVVILAIFSLDLGGSRFLEQASELFIAILDIEGCAEYLQRLVFEKLCCAFSTRLLSFLLET